MGTGHLFNKFCVSSESSTAWNNIILYNNK